MYEQKLRRDTFFTKNETILLQMYSKRYETIEFLFKKFLFMLLMS